MMELVPELSITAVVDKDLVVVDDIMLIFDRFIPLRAVISVLLALLRSRSVEFIWIPFLLTHNYL